MNKTITGEKRSLSVLLAVIMVLSMMPLSVFAANGAAAEVTTAGGGTVSYLNYADAVSYANEFGGTLKLLSNVEVQYADLDDVPFITGTFTLDLNGKSIDLIEVGSYGSDEETEEQIKGTPGALTVTDSAGSGKIGDLTVNTGALMVAGGTTEHLYADRYAATADITGGVVTELALNEYEGEEVCAAVSGGSVQWIRMSGGTLTVDGGDYPERMDCTSGAARRTSSAARSRGSPPSLWRAPANIKSRRLPACWGTAARFTARPAS